MVCRQLGYSIALEAPASARFGQGTGPIHMDNVACVGTEAQLADCVYSPTHNCGHGEDAGVVCQSEGMTGGAGGGGGALKFYSMEVCCWHCIAC